MRPKAVLAAVLCLALPAACRAPGPPSAAPAAAPPGPLQPPPGVPGRVHRVVPAESLLQVLVFRAGPLAKAGHNHVVASHEVEGWIALAEDPGRSSFALRVPVASLAVDEPQLRAALGPEFPPELPPSAREGTRANLLGPAVLDAARYPEVVVRGTSLEIGPGGDAHATLRIDIRGHTRSVRVPLRYAVEPERLTVRAEFPLTHAQLGLMPFSALLGALQVDETLQVRVRLVGLAANGAHDRSAGTRVRWRTPPPCLHAGLIERPQRFSNWWYGPYVSSTAAPIAMGHALKARAMQCIDRGSSTRARSGVQQAACQQSLQIAPSVGNDINDHAILYDAVDDAVGLEEDLAVLADAERLKLSWHRTSLGVGCERICESQ